MSSDQMLGWRPFGWLAGLPVLGLLWAGAMTAGAPHVTLELADAAGQIARECSGNPEPWLRLEVSGRDIVAMGEAPDADQRNAALARLAALPGYRQLIDRTALIETISPFVWQVSQTAEGVVVLNGHRPAEIGAKALRARLATAAPPNGSFDDRARAAYGAPPEFESAAIYAVGLLRALKPGAVVTLSDTEFSIEGDAASAAGYAGLPQPPRGFTLGRIAVAPPTVPDFRMVVARKADGGTVASGHVVSEAARTEFAMAAKEAFGTGVEDRMQTARGLPAEVDPGALGRFLLKLAGLVQDGTVRYEAGAVNLSGLALDSQAVGDITKLMRDERPAGVAAGSVALSAQPVSPYRLKIRREADAVVLTGHLPDQASREALLAALKPRFFREKVTDRTRTAEGAPSALVEAVAAGIVPLSTLASGEVAVSDAALRLSGESLYPEAAKRVGVTFPQAMPRGWSALIEVTPRDAAAVNDPSTCARLFRDRVTARPVRFPAGSSELRPDFYPVLDAIVEIAKSCPGQRVEVVGHADPAGAAVPPAKPLPEFAAAQAAEKAKPPKLAKEAKKPSQPAKPIAPKDAAKDAKPAPAKPEPKPPVAKLEPEPAPEPAPDLSEQRALAIVDYLRKAGLAADRAITAQPATPNERQGMGFALRS